MNFDIKNIKPLKDSKYYQGYYKPVNMIKYNGKLPIIYRSLWEKKFCYWCDNNDKVISWSSEPFPIKYFNMIDNKFHDYFVDFYFKYITGLNENNENIIQDYVVEVKPKSQLIKPKQPKKQTIKSLTNYKLAYETYVKNLCKIESLKKFADERNIKVLLLTEDSKLF